MRKLDILTALIVVFSLFMFFKPSPNQAGPISLKVYEGEVLPTGGRNGTIELGFRNILDFETTCNITVSVTQLFGVTYLNETQLTFAPNLTYTNISIFLPNGKNKVSLDAKC
ncbi:MAG: hypothetical protein GOV01_00920 [Candidatus Altiarchaeota archaeon]|nr:hypothetical protein [Candidatus Altiarchaeota archaeon]